MLVKVVEPLFAKAVSLCCSLKLWNCVVIGEGCYKQKFHCCVNLSCQQSCHN